MYLWVLGHFIRLGLDLNVHFKIECTRVNSLFSKTTTCILIVITTNTSCLVDLPSTSLLPCHVVLVNMAIALIGTLSN